MSESQLNEDSLPLPSTGPFLLHATFVVKPEKIAEVSEYLTENKIFGQAHEPGTLEFHMARKDNKIYAWEKYADREALAIHRKDNPGLHKLVVNGAEIFLSPPQIEILEIVC